MATFFILADFFVSWRLRPNGFLNNLKFSRQADITSIKIEFEEDIDPLTIFEM